jgi:hypothetical protein
MDIGTDVNAEFYTKSVMLSPIINAKHGLLGVPWIGQRMNELQILLL